MSGHPPKNSESGCKRRTQERRGHESHELTRHMQPDNDEDNKEELQGVQKAL